MVLSLDKWIGKVAIVTGASGGIGASIAEQLAELGVIVAGFARRIERVEDLSKKLSNRKGKLHAVRCDVSKEEEVLEAFEWVKTNLGPIHILVNNAGVAFSTTLRDGNTELWKSVLETNVLGLCICTREAIRDMKEHNTAGHIIHINSVVGHNVPTFVGLNIYPASKFAVTALTETLRQELNREGLRIKVTSVSPGAVVTEFLDVGGFSPGILKTRPVLQPEDITDAVLYALSTPPYVQIHELTIAPQ